uniref:FACD2 protein n=1 Tax=Chelydra serpentina TaxID=8475 RepID=A0A8C3RQS0_CHESE
MANFELVNSLKEPPLLIASVYPTIISLAFSETKKSRISCKEKTSAEDGVVENDSVFVQLIKTAGITLNAGERQNDIAVDQAIFQKKLCQILRKHPFYPHVVQEFVSGLETHIKDRDQFRNCLLPCAPVQGEALAQSTKKPAPAVITLLLEKLPEFFFDTVGTFGTNFPRLIVNQFKWLDKILDSKELVMKLMQMVSVSPAPIQHDIITSLPEILEDSQQSEVAREVSQLLKRDTRLTVPILDALSSLDLDAGLLAEVRQSAMIIVPAVKLEDLPVVIKFILHNVKAVDTVEVQYLLCHREEIEVSSSQNCVKLLFDVIKLAVRFQKGISEAWIKVRLCVLDLIVLLLIHTTNTKSRKQIERVLRNKIPLGCLPEQLLQSAFQNHSLVIKDFFPSILSLAQTFLHSADPCVVSFGSCMYKQAFAAFDSYCRQEVVSALVTHVCGGNDVEVDISLDVLTDLVTLCTSSLIRYATFVKNVLDYTEKLNPQQIRKLFYILGELAFSQRQEDCYIQDDMHMVIRKWLSSTVPKYKQMGIIGAITVAGCMAAKRLHPHYPPDSAHTTRPIRRLSILLDLVSYCCEQSPEALALYYDELANLIEKQKGNLDSQILERIGKSVVEDFSNDFVVDLTPAVDGVHLFPVKSLYNLDEDESQGTIVINLLPLLSQNSKVNHGAFLPCRLAGAKIVSPECLSPSFRLLRLYTTEQHNGSMEEIDALLGCPLYLTDLEIERKLDSLAKQEREFLCSLLFHALNWFREVVNAFCQQQDLEMKGKVLTRLQNITELQNMLGKCLAASPGYVPPPAIFDCEALEAAPPVNAVGLVKKKKTGRENYPKILMQTICGQGFSRIAQLSDFKYLGSQQGKACRNIGFSHLCQRSSQEVAQCAVELLKPLCNHMENMHNYFQALITENQGVVDGPRVNIQEHQLMSSCYQQLLQAFRLLFACESFHYLLNFQHSVPNFQCALTLTQLLIVIAEKPMASWKKDKIASLAKQFLCQSWMQPSGMREKGSQFSNALHTLLCVYMEHTDNILKAVEDISSVGVPELINSANDGYSSTYPTLTRQTFPVFFQVMMTQLENSVRSIPAGKPSDSSEVEKLLHWNVAVRDFHILVNLVKVFDSRPVLSICLKYGRLFVEAFLKLAMPLLDYSFKKHREDVQSLLKTLQLSTRQLHHMCGHSKIHQDLGLTNHVPLLKKSLEQFVYRVKAMLAFNHCQEAFWVGTLKNRDLQVRITALSASLTSS